MRTHTAVMMLLSLLWSVPAWAGFEYRYLEAEKYREGVACGLRHEGFTSWMGHPSGGQVMVLADRSEGWLEYEVSGLSAASYHVFVRGLAWASGADVEVWWDGRRLGRVSYASPGTALRWSREVGVVQGPGDHKLRLVGLKANTQAPYLDTVLLTTQEGLQPSDDDQDFRSFTTPLPLLKVAAQDAPVAPEPAATEAAGAAVTLASLTATALSVGQAKVSASIRNQQATARSLHLAAALGEDLLRVPVALPPSGQATAEVACQVNRTGRQKLHVELREGERVLLAGTYAVVIPPAAIMAPAETALPVGTPRLRWSAQLQVTPEVAAEFEAEVSLSRADGTVLQRCVVPGKLPAVAAEFATAQLPVGRYQVHGWLSRQGQVAQEQAHDLVVYQPQSWEPWEAVQRTSADGDRLLLNGRPFLGRLLFHAAPEPRVREQGFNLLQCFGGDPNPLDSIQRHLDLCRQHGLWGTVALFNNRWLCPGPGFDLAHLAEAVQRFKGHPAVFAWDLIDEPDGAGMAPALVAEAARLVRRLDPNHLVWVNLCQPTRLVDYREAQDYWSYDTYPFGSIQGAGGYLPYLDVSDRHLRGRVPLGTCLQTWSPAKNRMPTATELRCGAWLHIIHDYRWFGYYSFYDPPPSGCLARDAALFSYTRALNAELLAAAPLITARPGFASVACGLPATVFQAARKQVGERTWLVGVNLTERPLRARVPAADGRWSVSTEGREVNAVGGRLEETYEPFGVHVYVR